jgi:UDP-glucose 4-epimerase
MKTIGCAYYFSGSKVLNLGLGNGTSVLELLHTFTAVTGIPIPTKLAPRRYGDVATLICDSRNALRELDWAPSRDLISMCKRKVVWVQNFNVTKIY